MTITIAGSGSATSSDGYGTAAGMNTPWSIVLDPLVQRLYWTEPTVGLIRSLLLTTMQVTTFLGSTGVQNNDALDNGVGLLARFNQPRALELSPDGTQLYVGEYTLCRVRLVNINKANLLLSSTKTVFGSYGGSLGQGCGNQDDFGTNAALYRPTGLNLDWKNQKLYITQDTYCNIRVADLNTSWVSTFVGWIGCASPYLGIYNNYNGDYRRFEDVYGSNAMGYYGTAARFSTLQDVVSTTDGSTLYVAGECV